MGEVVSLLHALDCQCCSDFNRYVLNSAHCSSRCGEDCCEVTIDTDEVVVAPPLDSEEELEVGECLRRLKG
jgi:hypothetical protein